MSRAILPAQNNHAANVAGSAAASAAQTGKAAVSAAQQQRRRSETKHAHNARFNVQNAMSSVMNSAASGAGIGLNVKHRSALPQSPQRPPA